ncbi:MBL fold metallo-hydrolase [Pseudolysinimonas sp.]|jgi:glyoxylase-like metal-dependent hydrolase (beta-lactamase superfamily II)|uniref:MBL fold metallo-hydrolase n=1 Tax=Pseudolysinimonas sp. TaxID=2680009 RepID=UPI003784050A
MLGTIVSTHRDQVTIHTYTSPEAGLEANTHIVALATQTLVLDTQYGRAFADEAAEFARSLGKPVTRVYISHDHPDHFFGTASFSAPAYALAETRASIDAIGPGALAGAQAALGDAVPETLAAPSITVEPGEEVIDGVRFVFTSISDTEAGTILVISLPDEGIVFAQDLVYNNLHLYIAEHHLDSWRSQVQYLKAQGFGTVLPGHGAPGGSELYDFVLAYLDVATPALASATDGDQLKKALISAFPEAGGTSLLDIQNRYIFPAV